MKRVIFEKWQMKKLLIWFLGFVIIGAALWSIIDVAISGFSTYMFLTILMCAIILYMAASVVDKAIIIAAVFLIIKFIPQKAADFFSISKKVPIAIFVDSLAADRHERNKREAGKRAEAAK